MITSLRPDSRNRCTKHADHLLGALFYRKTSHDDLFSNMCGLVGFIDHARALRDPQCTLEAMADAVVHRGPDGHGYAHMAPAFFGHRRLSIIDVEGGAQPMSTQDGRYTVIYNGEIYNFKALRDELQRSGIRLSTHCDTEVLPYLFARHGVEMVSKLNGMFAFAIWDRVEKRLFAARDRLGIKPFFYSHGRAGFVFASELRSLLKHPHVSRETDTDALSMYFTLNYVPEPSTAYAAVKKLPAGHWLLLQDETLEIHRYWDLERIVPEPVECSEGEALHELDIRLRQVIRSQMVSDVPLGAFLSGGIDSGLVVSYMAELSRERVKTFSISFEEETHNELPLARIVAERYRTDHHELVVRPNAVDLLSRMVEHFGEPFGDSSCIPTFLVSQLARGEVTVCLSGDGGDEVFAGYTHYVKVAAIDKLRVLPRPLLAAARSMARLVDRPTYRSAQRMLKRAALPFAESYLEGVCFLDEAWAGSSSDVSKRFQRGKTLVLDMFRNAYRGESAVRAAQYVDIKTSLVNDMLTKVDRASMAVSLEVRVPLLDNDFVTWANALPVHLKQRGSTGKRLMKKLAHSRLSEQHVLAPKMGFDMPLSKWLRGALKEMVHSHLVDRDAGASAWLDRAMVANIVRRHMDGVEDHSRVIWSLLFFEMWRRTLQ